MHTPNAPPKRGYPFLARLIDTLPARFLAPATTQLIRECEALLSAQGEVSGRRLASQILEEYARLDAKARAEFFDALAIRFAPPLEVVKSAAQAYAQAPSDAALITLQSAVEPPRQELFRRLNFAPSGTAALVALRKDLLAGLATHPAWQVIDADLLHLFRSWFNPGFLTLEQIAWRTSAHVLERLIEYEAVHQIQGWSDLRRRLQSDRRCYAYFHPSLPDEPLIFIEVALTRSMVGHVPPLLDPQASVDDPARATCAMFYSITNCQIGLRSVSFGNGLIKQVVEVLSDAFPKITTYATVSPIPGFRDWLAAQPDLPAAIGTLAAGPPEIGAITSATAETKEYLLRACAHYLTHAKRDEAPLDPVARFHLANGARLERLNWAGDSSVQGLRRALGLTVNYVYRLRDVEKNHEQYANDKRVVASAAIERLAAFHSKPKPRTGKAVAAQTS